MMRAPFVMPTAERGPAARTRSPETTSTASRTGAAPVPSNSVAPTTAMSSAPANAAESAKRTTASPGRLDMERRAVDGRRGGGEQVDDDGGNRFRAGPALAVRGRHRAAVGLGVD